MSRGILFVKNLREEIEEIKPCLGNLVIKKLDSFEELNHLEIPQGLREAVRRKFKPDIDCFMGIIDKKIVHLSFVDYNHPVGVILFGDFTLPEYRGKHINPAVKSYIFNYLQDKGIRKVYISCARNNLSSKRSILRAGFKKLNLWQRIIIKIKIWIKKARSIIFT